MPLQINSYDSNIAALFLDFILNVNIRPVLIIASVLDIVITLSVVGEAV